MALLFLLLLLLCGLAPGLHRLHRRSRRGPCCEEGKVRGGRTQQEERETDEKRPLNALPTSFFVVDRHKGVRGFCRSLTLRSISLFRSTKKLHTMPPQQRPPPPPNARAVDAEASVGLRTLALQFEAAGKWAQVREANEFFSISLLLPSGIVAFLSHFSLFTLSSSKKKKKKKTKTKTGHQVLRRLPRHRRRRAARRGLREARLRAPAAQAHGQRRRRQAAAGAGEAALEHGEGRRQWRGGDAGRSRRLFFLRLVAALRRVLRAGLGARRAGVGEGGGGCARARQRRCCFCRCCCCCCRRGLFVFFLRCCCRLLCRRLAGAFRHTRCRSGVAPARRDLRDRRRRRRCLVVFFPKRPS